MNQTLTTCPEFVAHPHIVEQKIYSMDGTYLETRKGGCYQCQCALASEDQGVNSVVKALGDLGISATVEQTGGFTMCAYVQLTAHRYIYANPSGASVYDEEGYMSDICQFDEDQPAEKIAQEIHNFINK
jgi:hypothetical protein